jgi:hypothetical protein
MTGHVGAERKTKDGRNEGDERTERGLGLRKENVSFFGN